MVSNTNLLQLQTILSLKKTDIILTKTLHGMSFQKPGTSVVKLILTVKI